MPIAFVSLCARRTVLSQLPIWHRCGGVWGQSRLLLEGTLQSGSSVLPAPAYSPLHPAYPGHQHLVCHRLGAMGNGSSRWQSALSVFREGRPPAGLAVYPRKPWPFYNCSGGRKPSHGTCFLLASGQWPRVLCCFLFRPAVGEGQLFFPSSFVP